jgi:hypothetical protein
MYKLVTAMLLFFSTYSTALYAGSDWEFLYEHDGIKVHRLNTPLPTFKAEGRLQANLYELLAIMADVERRIEWVANLSEIKIIEGDPESKVYVYNRFDLPWPASDRDSIIEGTTRIDYQNQEVEVSFVGVTHSTRPEIPGVVRITNLQGSTKIKYVDDTQVDVVQQATIDSGGNIPHWVAKIFAEDQPINTIKAMKKQLEKTKGQYADFIARHNEKAKSLKTN